MLFFMLTNKNVRDAVCNKLLQENSLPWKEYTKKEQDNLKKYYSVRDYFIFSYIKLILKSNHNFHKVNNLIRQMSAPHYLSEKNNAEQDSN